MSAAVKRDRQTVAKNGRVSICVDDGGSGGAGARPSGVAVSPMASEAWMDIDPWTENARWIGEGAEPDPLDPFRG